MVVEIRPYQSSDLDALITLMIQLQAHERQFDLNLTEPTPEFAAAYLSNVFENVEKYSGVVLVAMESDSVCGFAAGHVAEDLENATHHFYIAELVVSESHRGQGIGTKLIQALEDYARSMGLKRLRISVLGANEGAYRLYQTLGYVDYVVTLLKTL